MICSETLITGTLGTGARSDQLQAPVRHMLEDHAADEALHRSYFIQCFRNTWVGLTSAERDLIVGALPAMLDAYLRPDTAAIASVLRNVPGLLGHRDIAIEIATHSEVASATRAASRTTIQMFGNLVPGLLSSIGEELDARGLWTGPVDEPRSAG